MSRGIHAPVQRRGCRRQVAAWTVRRTGGSIPRLIQQSPVEPGCSGCQSRLRGISRGIHAPVQRRGCRRQVAAWVVMLHHYRGVSTAWTVSPNPLRSVWPNSPWSVSVNSLRSYGPVPNISIPIRHARNPQAGIHWVGDGSRGRIRSLRMQPEAREGPARLLVLPSLRHLPTVVESARAPQHSQQACGERR